MTDIGGLQLLPSQKKKINFGELAGNSRFLSVAIGLLILLGIGYGILAFLTSRVLDDIAELDLAIVQIHHDRNKDNETTVAHFSKQLSTIQTLLKSHRLWSDKFERLQTLVASPVTFRTLEADAELKLFKVQATANSYSTVARQIAAFYASDDVANITVSNVSLANNGSVEFSMEIKLK